MAQNEKSASFVDTVTLHVRAGNGGDGCVSTHREKFKPLGGPDGGRGGNGGNIIVVSDPQVTTLLDYQRAPHRKAANGGPGMGSHRDGHAGDDVVLSVPVGTVVKNAEGEELADLAEPGQQWVVAPGGIGGLGNAALASPKKKAPGFALLGTPGWEGDVQLELKTLADVALVGYPSAGKSSLISSLSAARPKVADYPFTTLHPHLGVVAAGDVRYTIADVPGLIEGASAGRGLGLDFLRHIERCSVIVHVLDTATFESERDPVSDLEVIRRELALYEVADADVPLIERPQLVVLNKVDVPFGREMAVMVRSDLEARGFPVYEVSAVSHEGLRELSFALATLVSEERKKRSEATPERPRVILRPRAVDDAGFTVRVEGTDDEPIYRIRGEKPERWVVQTDFANDEAVGFLADRLAKLGVETELARRGATPGVTVVIGGDNGVVFDWDPSLASVAELVTSSRGTDIRLIDHARPTRAEKREQYYERMDAKAEARAKPSTWYGRDDESRELDENNDES